MTSGGCAKVATIAVLAAMPSGFGFLVGVEKYEHGKLQHLEFTD
jgi:hypothetical protein